MTRAPVRLSLLSALALVGVAAFLAGASSLGNGFAYDDEEVVVGNPRVTDPALLGTIWTSSWWGPGDNGGLYRPVTILSFALNHRVGGLRPFGYHLVNVLLHAAVALLVLLAAAELLPLPAALAGALLFAVHPVHTEAVANVVGRAELLAALGFLGAWLLHGGGGAWTRRVAAALAFAFGAFSKEVAVVLPAALLARDILRRRRPDPWSYGLYAIVLAVYFGLRHHVLGGFAGIPGSTILRMDNVIATLPFLPGLWTALAVFGRYLVLLAFPWRLSADYSYPQIDAAGAGDPWAWVGLLGAAGLLWLVLRAWRGTRVAGGAAPADFRPAFGLGLALFGITLAPVSNVLIRIGTVMGERLLYLPSAGFLVAVAALWGMLWRSRGPAGRRWLAAATALLVLAGAARSTARNLDWKSSASIHAATAKTSPRSGRARYNNAVSIHDAGRLDEAIEEMQRAVRLDPGQAEAWLNLGAYKLDRGRPAEAREDLSRALELDPGASRAWFNSGLTRAALGDTAGAIRDMERAVRLNPRHVEAWVDLGGYRLATGNLDRARSDLLRAVAVDSTSWTALVTLGALELRAHRPIQALDRLEKAVVLNAGAPDAWLNLALARVALGDTAGAIAAYRRVVDLGPGDAGAHNDLAWFLALTGGPLDEALRHAERAVEMEPSGGNYDTLAEVLYRSGRIDEARRAWREALARGAGDPVAIRRKVGGL